MKNRRIIEKQMVRILRDAEASTIEQAARNLESQHNPFIGGTDSLDRWRWAIVHGLRHLGQENMRLKKSGY